MPQLWTILDRATGEVLCATFPTDSFGQHPKDAGWAWHAATQRAVRIEEAVDLVKRRWDQTGWAADVVALRARRWALIRDARERAQDAGCASPLGRVDTDLVSRGKISGAVQLAMIAAAAGAPFAIGWTMSGDNTEIHDAAAMIALGMAVGQHVAACHAEAVARRTLLEAAADEAAIAAVPVNGGWPGEIE